MLLARLLASVIFTGDPGMMGLPGKKGEMGIAAPGLPGISSSCFYSMARYRCPIIRPSDSPAASAFANVHPVVYSRKKILKK